MRDFAALFKGREDAHGHYFSLAGRKATDRGKMVSKAKSEHLPVTPALIKGHLAGKERLGIIPVMKDGRVWWFVIDVDFYKIGEQKLADVDGYKKIAQAIKDLGLPLVLTASKSGGAHLWCFLAEPLDAESAHVAAKAFNEKLNLPSVLGIPIEEYNQHVDIFPKDFSPDNIGSWVNLPYFGDQCHCYGEDGDDDLDLPAFIRYANAHITGHDDLSFKRKEKSKAKGTKSDRPPCIDYMIEHGVPEGHRNNACTQFAIFALKAFPDNWEDELDKFNEAHCQPPLRRDEVAPIKKSVGSKQYEGYMCEAMQAIFCDKGECRKRAFGIGRGAQTSDVGIKGIEKIDGEEPVYLIEMNGKKFPVSIDELLPYQQFRRRAAASTNRLPPSMKQGEWEDILNDLLDNMEITEPAADTQMRDRVIRAFQGWVGQSCVTSDFDEAMANESPYYDGKSITFSGDKLMSQLDRQLGIARDQVYIIMRNWNTTIVERKVKGKSVQLWYWLQNGPLWFDPTSKGKKL